MSDPTGKMIPQNILGLSAHYNWVKPILKSQKITKAVRRKLTTDPRPS
jgi:hypothetical protein